MRATVAKAYCETTAIRRNKCTLIKMLQKFTSAVPLRISASPFCLNWPQAVAVMKKPQKSDGLIPGANPRLITGLPASLKRQVWEMIMQMKKKLNSLLKYTMTIVCHQWKMVATDITFQIPWILSDKSKVRLWVVSLWLGPYCVTRKNPRGKDGCVKSWEREAHVFLSPRISSGHIMLAVFLIPCHTHDGLNQRGANYSPYTKCQI